MSKGNRVEFLADDLHQKFCCRVAGWREAKGYVEPEMGVTVLGMDKTMKPEAREKVIMNLRRRYLSAGWEHQKKLLDQAQELLGYHRKSAIRALRAVPVVRRSMIIAGRPMAYEPKVLLPILRLIWELAEFACGRRLVAILPEWLCGAKELDAHQAKFWV